MNKTHLQNFISKVSPVAFAAASLFVLGASSAHASSSTWTQVTGGIYLWSNTADWSGGVVPGSTWVSGSTASTNNTDSATFGTTLSAGVTITLETNRNLENITFSGSSNSYTIYTAAGNVLNLTAGGSITNQVTSTSAVVFYNDAINLEGNYTFNGSGTFGTFASSDLSFGTTASGNMGSITQNVAGTLTLTGTFGVEFSTGSLTDYPFNSIGAFITDSAGAPLSLLKNGVGTWALTNTNSFRGNVTIDQGVLTIASLANDGSVSSIGIGNGLNNGADLIFDGGELQYGGYTGASGAQPITLAGISTNRLFTIGDATGGSNSAQIDSSDDSYAAYGSTVNAITFSNGGKIVFNDGGTGAAGANTLILSGSNVSNNTFNPQLTDNPAGGATSLVKAGAGTWILGETSTNANTYSGSTTIYGGELDDPNGYGLPSGSLLDITGNGGVYQTNGTFNRTLGASAGNFEILGGRGGLGAYGGSLSVTLTPPGGGSTVQFGSTYFSPSELILNNYGATGNITVNNSFDVNGATRSIDVDANTAIINGLSNTSANAGGLNKGGNGMLEVTQASTMNGPVGVSGGVLWAKGSGTLGTYTGTINVAPFAELRLDSASGVASGAKALLNNDATLGLTFNATQATITSLLNSASTGVIGIDSAGQSSALNMNTLGNGLMYLGSSTTGTYSAGTLTSSGGSEPIASGGTTFGGTYRLGGGGGTLIITGQNVLTDQPSSILPQNLPQSLQSSNNYNSVVIGDGYSAGQPGGGGTVDIQNYQNYSGTTTINAGGILNLDFSNLGSAASNVLGANAAGVYLQGGTLQMTGASSATDTQTINGLNLTQGASAVTMSNNSAASATLNLGAIGNTAPANNVSPIALSGSASTNYNLGTLLFNETNGGTITTTNSNLTTGQYLFNNGTSTSWAMTTGSGPTYTVAQLTGETTLTTGSTATNSSTNYLITTNGTLTVPASQPDSMNLLRLSPTAGSSTLAMGANKLTTNGILFNGASGTYGVISGTGGITSANGNLYIYNTLPSSTASDDDSTTYNDLDINGAITGNTNVIFGGTGTIALGAVETYTGNTYLDGATVELLNSNSNPFGSLHGALVINSGTLTGGYTSAYTISAPEIWNGNFSLLRSSNGPGAPYGSSFNLTGPITLTNNITITTNTSSLGGGWQVSGVIGDGGYGYGITIGSTSLNPYNPTGTDNPGNFLNGGLDLGAANTFTGSITVLSDYVAFGSSGGYVGTNRWNTLVLGADSSAVFNSNGSTYQVAGLADAGAPSTTETVSASATAGFILDLDGMGKYSYGGGFGSPGSYSQLYMQGPGTQILTGNINLSNGTSSNDVLGAYGGTLEEDASQGGTVTAYSLSFGGGTFIYRGAASGTSSQSFTSTLLGAVGGSNLIVDSSLGATTLNLGTASFGTVGTTLDIQEPYAGATVTSSTGNSNGVWNGGRAVITTPAGTFWVTSTSNVLGAYTGETALPTSSGATTSNFLLTGSQTQTGATGINLLRVTNTSSGSLSLGANALTLNGNGVLFDGGANYSITGGTIGGPANKDLIIQNYGSAGTTFTIGSTIINTNGGANLTTLDLAGTGTTVLTAVNSYGGATYLNGGITNFNQMANFGTTTGINFDGGTLQYATSSSFTGTNDLTTKTIVVGTGDGTVDTNGNNVTWAGSFGSTSAATSNLNIVDSATTHGSVTMTGTDSDPGTLTIQNGGTVILGNAASGGGVLGNGINNGTYVGPNGTLEGGTTTTARTGPSSTASYAGKLTLLSGGTIAPGNPTSANVQNVTPDYSHSYGNMGSTATYNVLSAAQLTWYAGGTLSFQLDNSSFSNNSQTIFGTTALNPSASTMLNLGTGALVKAGGQGQYILNFNNTGGYYWDGTNLGTNVYDLINFGSTGGPNGDVNGDTSFNVDDFTIENLNGIGVLSFYYNSAADGGTGQEELLLTVIPEPSTWAMLIGGLVALVFWTRRKRTTTVRSFIKK